MDQEMEKNAAAEPAVDLRDVITIVGRLTLQKGLIELQLEAEREKTARLQAVISARAEKERG